MFITQHYTLYHAILYLWEFIGHIFSEKGGNQSKRQLFKGKS